MLADGMGSKAGMYVPQRQLVAEYFAPGAWSRPNTCRRRGGTEPAQCHGGRLARNDRQDCDTIRRGGRRGVRRNRHAEHRDLDHALRTTKLPTGPGYSMVAMVDATFPPIELVAGFTLNGVGGLLRINRTVSTDALEAGIKAKTLSNFLHLEKHGVGVRQEHDELADEYEADGIGQLEQEREVDRDRRRRATSVS